MADDKTIVVPLGKALHLVSMAELQALAEPLLLLEGSTVVFDGGEVEVMDTAAVQYLLGVIRCLNRKSNTVQWQQVSAKIHETAALLGASKLLGIGGGDGADLSGG